MKGKFFAFIAVIALIVIGLGFLMNHSSNTPSKYEGLAKALTSDGAKFYGAFWCPHCRNEKSWFGDAAKYLPYVECSNPDQSSTKICIDNKIESFPTWKFKDGITLTSKGNPIVCDIRPGKSGEPDICAQTDSQYYRTWIFPEYKFSIKSVNDPTVKNGVWKFDSNAETTGEIPLDFLAAQIGYQLPQ